MLKVTYQVYRCDIKKITTTRKSEFVLQLTKPANESEEINKSLKAVKRLSRLKVHRHGNTTPQKNQTTRYATALEESDEYSRLHASSARSVNLLGHTPSKKTQSATTISRHMHAWGRRRTRPRSNH